MQVDLFATHASKQDWRESAAPEVSRRIYTCCVAASICLVLLLTPSVSKAGPWKDAAGIAIDLAELVIKVLEDEADRRRDEEERNRQQPEGLLYVHNEWSGFVRVNYPWLEKPLNNYRVAILIRNKCDRPLHIEPYLFSMTQYYTEPDGRPHEAHTHMNRWQYEDAVDLGQDILPSGWISPDEEVKGYIIVAYSDGDPTDFRFKLSYGAIDDGEEFSKSNPGCRIQFL